MAGVPVTVTPAGRFRVDPSRLVPAMVAATLVPCTPVTGVMVVKTGVGGLIVKASGLLVPPAVVTPMVCAPVGAVAAMARVAEICVAEMVGVPVTVTPVGRFRVDPSRLVPAMSAATLVPCTPIVGLMLVSVGPGGLMVKVSALLAPPVVVTVMLLAPRVAVAAMAKVAVIWVAVATGVAVAMRAGVVG